jgi:hypothetical protein
MRSDTAVDFSAHEITFWDLKIPVANTIPSTMTGIAELYLCLRRPPSKDAWAFSINGLNQKMKTFGKEHSWKAIASRSIHALLQRHQKMKRQVPSQSACLKSSPKLRWNLNLDPPDPHNEAGLSEATRSLSVRLTFDASRAPDPPFDQEKRKDLGKGV